LDMFIVLPTRETSVEGLIGWKIHRPSNECSGNHNGDGDRKIVSLVFGGIVDIIDG